MTIKKITTIILVSLVTFMSSVAPMTAQATSNNGTDNEKINICHGTPAEANPWNAISINSSSWSTHQSEGDFLYDGPLKDNGQPSNEGDSWCESYNPSPTATIHATKIVCDNESDLPNWGAGIPANITANTATDFLANHPTCRLASDWQFEWAPSNAIDGGASTLGHVSGYTTFGPTSLNNPATAQVPLANIGDRIWVREILKEGYIPFSGLNTTENISAELYCYEDGLNYDNYDFIVNPQNGQTYHCVAWNVLKEKTQVENSCPLPTATVNDSTDTTPETIGATNETPVQTILDAHYTGINANSDQKQYQEWNSSLSQQITVSPKFLSRNAGYNAVFGYYKNGDLNTFTPVFRTGNVDPSDILGNAAPVATNPSDVFVAISTGATKIGFAIKAWNGSAYTIAATQNNLSTDGLDRALVYNPSANKYAIGFEDYTDWDYNDLIVEVSLTCTTVTPEIPQMCNVSSNTDTKVTKIVIGDSSPSLVDMLSTLVTPTSITDAFWMADVDGVLNSSKWIWSEDPVTDWTVDKYVTFTRTFSVSETGTSATLTLATDNSYEVFLDANLIGANSTESVFNTATGDTITIPSLSVGTHTLTFVVKNWAQEGSALNNPGGLLYNLKLNNDTCNGGGNGGPNNTAPTLTLNGNAAITLTIGQTFSDIGAGATAVDAEDGTFTYPGTVSGFTVTGLPPVGTLLTTGTYTITYKYTDSNGADSNTVTRIVTVITGTTQCSDGLDNDTDSFIDSQDPNCHTDGSNSNPGTYDPTDNDEDAPVVVTDVCPNLDGVQTTLPANMQIVSGICIPTVIVDVCSNIDGIQVVIPVNMHQEGTNCVDDVTPPTDVCSNIEGNQATVPEGKVQNGNACVDETNNPTDVCPDVAGTQTSQSECNNVGGDGDNNGGNGGGDDGLGGGDGILPAEQTGGRSGGSRRGGGTNTGTGGIVLGASTECGIYLYDFIKYGAENDREEVTKLQSFLNELLGSELPLNGIYDKKTLEAVNKFQLQYSGEVLQPWVNVGLHPNTKTPTGYVYRTTQRMINNIVCPALNLPLPDLSNER